MQTTAGFLEYCERCQCESPYAAFLFGDGIVVHVQSRVEVSLQEEQTILTLNEVFFFSS